ncbi:unnamed protein product [Mytilus coruscus]|uniref:CCHC-type domain-containing protein n=1 Tax=Mytilus coruscus TaxID=42192 RepID=A0A6J8AQT8_MYTCO|nr:unnamed protein product [Mytilus coruscus]
MDTPDDVETKRLRTLTVKAMENCKEKVQVYHNKLLEKRQAVEESLTYLEEQTGDIHEFCEYLAPQNTEQSNSELLVQKSVFQTIAKEVDQAIKYIDEQTRHSTKIETENSTTAHLVREDEPQLTIRNGSPVHHSSLHSFLHDQGNSSHNIQGHKSHSRSSHKAKGSDGSRSSNCTHSHSSQGSHSSKAILLDKTARAEAAKAKLKFIEEEEELVRKQNELELEIQKQRSELKSNLNILKHKREIAEAEAELTAVKELLEEENAIDNNLKDQSLGLPQSSPSEIVQNYVNNQILDVNKMKLVETDKVVGHSLDPTVKEFVPKDNVVIQPITKQIQSNVKSFAPQNTTEPTKFYPSSGVMDLTRYIMKKDLLISRLSTFDDKPERYCSWKNSFINILRELDATDSKQLDLLNRLDERYGAPESIAAALKDRLDQFKKNNNTEYDKLYELYDLLAEVESIKENDIYRTVLSFYDSSYGVNAIVGKLPNFIQTKWMDRASRYKTQHSVMYPPFSTFVEFLHSMAVRMNDPSLKIQQSDSGRDKKVERKYAGKRTPGQTVLKTSIERQNTSANLNLKCLIHENGKHNLADCKVFVEKPLEERREIVKKNGICFKCLNGKHLAQDCKANIKCEKCGKTAHCTAFHFERQTRENNGGERQVENQPPDQISTKCTEICDDSADPTSFQGKSCAKTLLVKVYPEGKPEVSVTTYAIIDDQSNRSLVCSIFIDHFNETTEPVEYMLASCSGKTIQHGRRTTGYILESLDGTTQLKCPSLIECNEIPISKREIATPAIARHYKHLQDIEQFIPELNRNAEVMLLIGRDVTAAHHILDQRIGKDNEPYNHSKQNNSSSNGRETNLKPCEYGFRVKDKEPDIGSTVFQQTREDDTLGLSQEDKEFLIVMNKEFHTSENGRLSAPLPFRRDRPKLQNNYHQARQRAENLTVANYGLRKVVCDHTDLDTCDDVCHYVNNNFYVEDGLVSGDSPEEIVSLIKRTKERLITGGKIRLHKIVSNNSEVVKSFETKDLAESITEIDFHLQLSKEEKPFTKRGLLSVINGIFDPLGFIAPVILGGRLIMREAVQHCSLDWDDPLSDNLLSDWQRWKQSLQDLETLEIGRPFTSQSLNDRVSRFERFSTWSRLVRAISLLKRKIVSNNRSEVDTKDTRTCVNIRKEAEALVLRETQSQYYSNEINCLKSVESSIIPQELQPDVTRTTNIFHPLSFAIFLNFLCSYHLHDIQAFKQSLQRLRYVQWMLSNCCTECLYPEDIKQLLYVV